MIITENRPRVLCVDDEPNVLESLKLNLHRKYDVGTARSGAEGIKDLEQHLYTAVVISDMRMPGMDGASFLSKARQVAPAAVRVLLTGQADMNSAIAAVNEGQIFKFLTKPCSPNILLETIESAVEQSRSLSDKRVGVKLGAKRDFSVGDYVRVINGARNGQLGIIKTVMPNPSGDYLFQSYAVEFRTVNGAFSEHYLGRELLFREADQRRSGY